MLTPGEGLVPQRPWTAEQTAFFDSLERNRKVVETWPQWKRDAAQSVFADCRQHVCGSTCARWGCTE